jgi:tetratricopeptide (TPR) repeat protein
LQLKKIYKPALFLVVLGAVMAFAVSCSTKKNTFTSRTYHNLTSHYNVYWNGMDNLRGGLKEYEAGLKDNYAMILPVYFYGDKASSGKIGQYADIAIKKAQKTIQKHSMVFNRKEQVNWIDDAYLLMGKGYFYKQDYGMARRTFEFVVKTYNDNEIKWDAMLWLAMANNQMGDYTRSQPVLDMLMSKIKQGQAPERLETPVNLSYAQYNILQKNYSAAAPYLERALELKPTHQMKTRCLFILGQMAQSNSSYEQATAYYKAVLKRNPSFDMSFNAQINLAQCYDAKTGDREYIVKKLNRMLKDEKNKDYLDQVYYALAQISLRDGDTASVERYLTLSVASSRQNNYQKAISALQLANIYFEDKNYPQAAAYYDSTMQFLPKDYPNYKEIAAKTATLTDLVSNLSVIQREDSLQNLASMAEADRFLVIDKIISALVAEEIRKKQEEADRREMTNLMTQLDRGSTSIPGSTASEGKWYFYNPSALSTGYSTFVRKWGRRKLEDNWFLSDKMVVGFSTESGQDTLVSGKDTLAGKQAAGKANNPKAREYYLKDIPLTDSLLKISNNKMILAYYNAGFIYLDGLEDLGNSVQSFETLQERFPGNQYEIQTDYELYQLYSQLKNQPKSDYYRNLILTQYPETDYAKLLVNPEYYKEIQARLSEAENLYEDTYAAFQNQQYYMVIHNAGIALEKYQNDTALIPRFDYLRALSLGKIEVEDSLVVALQGIIKKYPKSQVKALATSLLTYLSSQRVGTGSTPIVVDSTGEVQDQGSKLYTYHPNSVHFYVLLVDGSKVDVNALKIKITDFNQKFYSLEELQVNSLLLDNTIEMVTVNNFDDGQKAVDYLKAIRASKYVFTRLESVGQYNDFAISIENYPIFYRNKNTTQYIRFFEKNYPLD